VHNHYDVIFIEKTKNPVDIVAKLHPDLIEAVRILQVPEINFRDPVKVFYDFKRP